MNRLWTVTRVIFKNSSGLAFPSKSGKRANTKNRKYLLFALFIFIFAMAAITEYMIAKEILELGAANNFVYPLIKTAIPLGIILLFALTLTLTTSIFFLSNDNSVYLPLPIKPNEIFCGRMIVVLTYTYLMEAIFILPMLIAFDVVMAPMILAYVSQIIFFFVFPLIPLSLGFLLTLLLAKIFHISRHRDTFSIIIMCFFLVVVIGIQIASGSLSSVSEGESANAIQAAIEGLANNFNFMRFLSGFFERGIYYDNFFGLGQMAIGAIIALSVLALSFFIASFAYGKTLIGADDGATKRKKGDFERALQKSVKTTNPTLNYFKKEVRCLFRTPVFVFQLILPPIIMIIIIGISVGASFMQQGASFSQLIELLRNQMGPLFSLENGFMIPAIVATNVFLGAMSAVSSTSISREGNNAYLLKTYPISPLSLINAKIAIGVIVNSAFTLILLGAVSILLDISFWMFFLGALLSVVTNILLNYLLIFIDLRSPMLNWSNETAAVKQNKAQLIGMLMEFAFVIVFGLLAYVTYLLGMVAWLSFAILFVLLVLATLGTIYYIKYKGSQLLANI